MINKIICWDLDETLGDFTKVSQEILCNLKGEPIPRSVQLKKVRLRYGIKEVLKELSKKGYQHVIATSIGMGDVVKESLKRADITEEFSKIYLRDKTKKYLGRGKSCEDISKDLDLTEEEVYDKMMVVGNSYGDQPIDLEKLVFIYENRACLYDAKTAQEVIMRLNDENSTGFYSAFENLCNSNGKVDKKFRELNEVIGRDLNNRKKSPYKIVQLNGNLAISLGYSLQENRGFPEFNPWDEINKGVCKSFYGPVIKVLATDELKKPMKEFD